MTTRKPFLGFGWIICIPLLIGVVFSSIAGYLLFKQSQFIKNSNQVSGKVVDLHYQHKGGTAPIISYQWQGQSFTYQSDIHSKEQSYFINEIVPLYVNLANPEDVLIDTFTDRWLVLTVLGAIGSCAIFSTCFVVWYNMRK